MDQTSLQDGGAIERLIGGKEVRANLEASKKYVLQQQQCVQLASAAGGKREP